MKKKIEAINLNPMTDTLTSYLTFKLGDEFFAANVSKVLEILEIPKITKVPRSPNYMRGVINLRGSVLPVIDTRLKFGLPDSADTINTCIIVMKVIIENQELTIGAIVDAVQEVMEIDQSQIHPAPTIGSKYKTEFIDGMVKRDDQFIMMLNIDQVFSTNEATILQTIASESDTIKNKK
jgi:purine-binding chemotaxis protein CheW